MIYDIIKYLKFLGKYVVFDVEYFFDGYKNNKKYVLEILKVVKEVGVDFLDLCDINGGIFLMDIYNIIKEVVEMFSGILIGIYCYNDIGMVVVNLIMVVLVGVCQVQGIINGYGERCGNVDFIMFILNFQLKFGFKCVLDENIKYLILFLRYVVEIVNMILNERVLYVGVYVFIYKAGMYIDVVKKNLVFFEYINFEVVGNIRRIVLFEVVGRVIIFDKICEIDLIVIKDLFVIKEIIDELKCFENEGYQFEFVEVLFEMLIRKKLGFYQLFFIFKEFKVFINELVVEYSLFVIVKIVVDGVIVIIAVEGDGFVYVLDNVLRKVLEKFYLELKEVYFVDYKVWVLNVEIVIAVKVRVLIELIDGKDIWIIVGVLIDIVNVSWIVFVDLLEYKFCKEKVGK